MTDTATLRLFTALSLPESLIYSLQNLQKEIKKKYPAIKASWVRAESMHLTLKFMDNIHEANLKEIKTAMAEAAEQTPAFSLHAGGCGLFPSAKKARVLWSGVKGETHLLWKLHDNLETALDQKGFPRDKKRFSPHFTLARLKGKNDPFTLSKIIKTYQHHRSKEFLCNAIHLFKSDLKPSGAVHTRLFTAPLQLPT